MPQIDLELISEIRKSKGFSNADMAKKLNLSAPEKYFRREKGEYNFKAVEIPVLCRVLEIPMAKIFK